MLQLQGEVTVTAVTMTTARARPAAPVIAKNALSLNRTTTAPVPEHDGDYDNDNYYSENDREMPCAARQVPTQGHPSSLVTGTTCSGTKNNFIYFNPVTPGHEGVGGVPTCDLVPPPLPILNLSPPSSTERVTLGVRHSPGGTLTPPTYLPSPGSQSSGPVVSRVTTLW